MPLPETEAAALYDSGMSACEIARENGLTKSGAEEKIRRGGRHGLQWCPVCRKLEEV